MAVAWARGHQTQSDDFSGLEDDMRAANVPPEKIEEQRRKWEAHHAQLSTEERGEIDVYPENIEAVILFLNLQTCWEVPGLAGGRLTIPPADIQAEMDMYGVADRRDTYRRIKIMIHAAQPELADSIEARRK